MENKKTDRLKQEQEKIKNFNIPVLMEELCKKNYSKDEIFKNEQLICLKKLVKYNDKQIEEVYNSFVWIWGVKSKFNINYFSKKLRPESFKLSPDEKSQLGDLVKAAKPDLAKVPINTATDLKNVLSKVVREIIIKAELYKEIPDASPDYSWVQSKEVH